MLVAESVVPASCPSTNAPNVRPGSRILRMVPAGNPSSWAKPTIAARNRLSALVRSSSVSSTLMVVRPRLTADPAVAGWGLLLRRTRRSLAGGEVLARTREVLRCGPPPSVFILRAGFLPHAHLRFLRIRRSHGCRRWWAGTSASEELISLATLPPVAAADNR